MPCEMNIFREFNAQFDTSQFNFDNFRIGFDTIAVNYCYVRDVYFFIIGPLLARINLDSLVHIFFKRVDSFVSMVVRTTSMSTDQGPFLQQRYRRW